jgi:hypothetical protein
VRSEAEARYSLFGEVECPFFNDTVSFNAKGIKHLKFKRDTIARSRQDQFLRLKNIHLAVRIVEKSKTLQEYKEDRCFEERKSVGK